MLPENAPLNSYRIPDGTRLDGHNQLPKLVLGVTFADGIEVIVKPIDRQPKTAAA
jgi:hypothetical protein